MKEMQVKIESISDYLNEIEDLEPHDHTIFRGQRESWELIPKIGRLLRHGSIKETEEEMLRALKQESLPYLGFSPETDWDWLAIAQHHGLATRLLDWSRNPLVALWFAVREVAKVKKDGIVWVFTVPKEDIVIPESAEFKDGPFNRDAKGRTKAFQPRHLTNRIIAQNGWFTVHKIKSTPSNNAGKFIPLERNNRYKACLRKMVVPASAFSALRYALDLIGFNEASLFPGLDGLCKHIEWLHSLLEDEKD